MHCCHISEINTVRTNSLLLSVEDYFFCLEGENIWLVLETNEGFSIHSMCFALSTMTST
jgi:hypothetical protein